MAARKPAQLTLDEPQAVRLERMQNKQMVQELLRAAVQKFQDTTVQGVSDPTKFEAAYDAILFAALAVFAAQGYRITAAQGHHRIALEGLVGSIGGSQLLLDELDGLLSIRNEKYTGFATVRAPDMRLALEHARRILDDTSHWLREHFPGMLKP
ncbi:hypothetical protein [Cupriavidus alkaliphilus]|uniref:hypothetical protein n=1 Tax=Cupriavidus alkaliphilus TaxID=942866 RepID=UPI0008162B6A|nr:hypothetical protein [Cupriavidus alkaliphilus]SCB17713.1 hypothetical protein GA0116996_104102 [Cupriavidus alkaliphilus]